MHVFPGQFNYDASWYLVGEDSFHKGHEFDCCALYARLQLVPLQHEPSCRKFQARVTIAITIHSRCDRHLANVLMQILIL